MAVLGLRGCLRTFSSCGEVRLLSSWGVQVSHRHGFSCWGAQASRHVGFSSCSPWPQQLWLIGSKVLAEWLWRTGLLAPRPWHMRSSWTRDQTHIPCTGTWIPCFIFLVTSLQVTICLSTFHNFLLKLLNYLSYLSWYTSLCIMWGHYSINLCLLHLVILSHTLLLCMPSVTKYIVIIFALNSIISFKHVKNKQNKTEKEFYGSWKSLEMDGAHVNVLSVST